MPKYITVSGKTYRVKRQSNNCYALYHHDGFFKDEFFSYETKQSIQRALERDSWYDFQVYLRECMRKIDYAYFFTEDYPSWAARNGLPKPSKEDYPYWLIKNGLLKPSKED